MKNIIIMLLILLPLGLKAQLENPKIRTGNKLFIKKDFSAAESKYKQATKINKKSFVAYYNLAGAMYKQKNYFNALSIYDSLKTQSKNEDTLAKIYHNVGNIYVKIAEDSIQKQNVKAAISSLEKALENYKTSIKLFPHDKETKFNYLVAEKILNELKKIQQDNQQNQNQNKEQENKDENKNENKHQNQNDADGDGIPDDVEKGENPNKPRDTDKDGKEDYKDQDADNDGISDNQEAGSKPSEPQDTDKDGTADYRDLDSNNDGIPDAQEAKSIPYDEMMRILNAIQKGDIATYEEAQKNLQKNLKSNSNNW